MRAWCCFAIAAIGCGTNDSFTTGKTNSDGGGETGGTAGSGSGGRNTGGARTGGASGRSGGAGGAAGNGSGGASGSGGAVGTGGNVAGSGGAGGSAGSGGAAGSLADCPGAQPVPPGTRRCRTQTDCSSFELCTPTYISGGCGACFPAPHDCVTDTDCGTTNICVASVDGPCVCNGPGTVCSARCTNTSCSPDERCNGTTGHCEPALCPVDFVCPTGMVCDPARADVDAHGCAPAKCDGGAYTCPTGFACSAGAGVDTHGCAPIDCTGGAFTCPANTNCDPSSTAPHRCAQRACTGDSDCDCGACIQGYCRDRLFVCSPPPPP